MKSFKVNKIGDGKNLVLHIDLNKIVYDTEALKQDIEARCKILKGELAYNTSLGISIGDNKDAIDLSIINTICTTKGVASVTKFKSSLLGNTYSANVTIQTIYNEEIEVNI